VSNYFFSREKIRKEYGTKFTEGNKVTLLWKGQETFSHIFDSIKRAERLVCLEFYIYRNDETGKELAEILKQKASGGVKVYILYDHFGSFGTPMKFWKNLKAAGIQIRASRPFKWTSPFHYVHRDHKKLVIIDGKTVFTGGLNIANEYRGYHKSRRKAAWRDTGILMEGPIAGRLLDTFKRTWKIWKGAPINFDADFEPIDQGIPVLPVFVSSAKGRRNMRKLLYYSINHSNKSIYLTTAYFTPSRRMLHVLGEAVKRGVDVKLLLPEKSDILAAHYAGRAFFTRLLKAGVEIYNYHGEILHAKTAVFDCVWSLIGSANLDFQSLRRNDEGNVGIIDSNFGGQMENIFFEDLKRSEKISLGKWHRRPYHKKLTEHLFSLFRKRL
jgi:cardiolipin synthase